jgi:hypothetical protein
VLLFDSGREVVIGRSQIASVAVAEKAVEKVSENGSLSKTTKSCDIENEHL